MTRRSPPGRPRSACTRATCWSALTCHSGSGCTTVRGWRRSCATEYRQISQEARRKLADLYAAGNDDAELRRARELYIGLTGELAEDARLDERLWAALFRTDARRGDRLGLDASVRRLRSVLAELAEDGDGPEAIAIPVGLGRLIDELQGPAGHQRAHRRRRTADVTPPLSSRAASASSPGLSPAFLQPSGVRVPRIPVFPTSVAITRTVTLEGLWGVLAVMGIVVLIAASLVPTRAPREDPLPPTRAWSPSANPASKPSTVPDVAVRAPWVRAAPGAMLAGQQAEAHMRDLLLAGLPAGQLGAERAARCPASPATSTC